MKQQNLITTLMQKYQQHNENKPRFTSNNLYVGQIVMLHKIAYKQDDCNRMKRYNRTTPIKKFAIFYKKNDLTYVHIKTNTPLKRVEDSAECEFAIEDIVPFAAAVSAPLLRAVYNTKLNKKQICKIETENCLRRGTIPEADHLFGV